MRENLWDEARHTGLELRGKTLGIIGFGQTGQRVSKIAATDIANIPCGRPALHAVN